MKRFHSYEIDPITKTVTITKKFLEENHYDVTVIHLDDYCDAQRAELMEKVRKYNPRGTFPVVLMPNGKVIVGFRKTLLEEAMKK